MEYAAAKRGDIEYIYGDYIADYPGGRYGTVILIYCDLGTFGDRDRDTLLRNIYGSLEDGGVFIFDLFTPALVNDRHESRDWAYAPSGGVWGEGEYLLLSQTCHYPQDKAFGYRHNLLTDGGSRDFILWDRYYDAEEITGILEKAEFRNIDIEYDLLKGNNFTSNNQMFIVARKQG